jgi:hypothetical protein
MLKNGLKTALNMFVGALVASAVSFALAVQGNVPQNGFSAIDGTWLLGLSGGTNYTYQSGLTAAGTTQATSTQMPAGIYMLEVDTAVTNAGVALPQCVAGTQTILYNNTAAANLLVYPSITNNLITGVQDTINSSTSLLAPSAGLPAHASIAFACAKNGIWNAS